MNLYLDKWSHLQSAYATEDRQVVYRVRTPTKLSGRTSTITRVLAAGAGSDADAFNAPIAVSRPSSGSPDGGDEQHFDRDGRIGEVSLGMKSGQGEVEKVEKEGQASGNVDDRPFVYVAQVEFQALGAKLRFDGKEVETKNFFKKVGWSGKHRAFTGPDGKEYIWLYRASLLELILNDGSKTRIAKYHPQRFGVFYSKRKAYLEITPAGQHMMDTILMTFVYTEKLRHD